MSEYKVKDGMLLYGWRPLRVAKVSEQAFYDRIEELESKNERLQERIDRLQSRLDTVWTLPKKWQHAYECGTEDVVTTANECADELVATIKGDSQ